MVSSDEFKLALDLIRASKSVVITSHTRPDGDACGSVKAMCEFLKWLGKEAHPVFLSPLSDWYQFMFKEQVPIIGNDITEDQLHQGYFDKCDLVVIIDTNSYVQLPMFDKWLKETDKKVLVIDHHITGDGLGDVEVIDSTAAAAGEIVYDLMKHADFPMSSDVADALFVALSTDSGWFKFSNADSRLYRYAADLIDAGASPSKLYQKLYQNYSPARMRLVTRMMKSMELHFDSRAAFQVIMRKDFDETGSTGRDTENLIDECQRIGSVDVAVLFVELADGGFRCSLRSKGAVDVREIAQKYGGGGHTMASGVNLPGPFDKSRDAILGEIKLQLQAN